MKRILSLVIPVLVAGLAGCQCCGLTERYADHIDDVADHEGGFEWLYSPCFDLTRIGKPDWRSCGFNRLWCPCYTESCNQYWTCPFCAKETGVEFETSMPIEPPPEPQKTDGAPKLEPPPQPGPKTAGEQLPTLFLSDDVPPLTP